MMLRRPVLCLLACTAAATGCATARAASPASNPYSVSIAHAQPGGGAITLSFDPASGFAPATDAALSADTDPYGARHPREYATTADSTRTVLFAGADTIAVAPGVLADTVRGGSYAFVPAVRTGSSDAGVYVVFLPSATVVAHLPVCERPGAGVLDARAARYFSLCPAASIISEIDAHSFAVSRTIELPPVGDAPAHYHLDLTPDDAFLIVTRAAGARTAGAADAAGAVLAIDLRTHRVVATTPLPFVPGTVVARRGDRR